MIGMRLLLCCLALLWGSMISGCASQKERPAEQTAAQADSLRKKGDALLREGKFRAAMQEYLNAEKLDPEDAELRLMIGHVYANYYRRLDDAIRYYQQAIQLREDYSDAYNSLGVAYSRQKRWDEAIAMFQKALDNLFYPTPEFAYYNMAGAYESKGNNEKAAEYYNMAIELSPFYVEPYIRLGLLYRGEGKHRQALTILSKARSILEEREPKKARVSEREWKAYRSVLAGVCYYQAQSFAKLGRDSEAREACEKAMELAPEEKLRREIRRQLNALPAS
jgi:tetratricopeptide (TPR) repeat protein